MQGESAMRPSPIVGNGHNTADDSDLFGVTRAKADSPSSGWAPRRMREAALLNAAKLAVFSEAAAKYAKTCSREAYRQALIKAVVSPKTPQHA